MATTSDQYGNPINATGNGVDTQHPEYTRVLPKWRKMHDVLNWVDGVDKDALNTRQGDAYLPIPSGILRAINSDDMANRTTGLKARAAYIQSAQMPTWVKDSRRGMVGIARELDNHVELPKEMEYIRENACADGVGLDQLFYRTVSEVLAFGRCSLVVDVDDSGRPFIALYDAFSMINWKEGSVNGRHDVKLAVFKEYHEVGDNEFSHDREARWRVLSIDEEGNYKVRKFNDELGNSVEDAELLRANGSRLEYMPMVICGSRGTGPAVDEMPLEGMLSSSVVYYRTSANYDNALALTCHPQLVIAGTGNNKGGLQYTGPGVAWEFDGQVDVRYVEPACNSLEEVRQWMEIQKNSAMESGSKTMDVGAESGEARKARQSDQRATLGTVVVTAGHAIEQCLRFAADIMGVKNPDKTVKYTVTPEFNLSEVNPQVLSELSRGVDAGRVSYDTYFTYMTTGKMPDRDYNAELVLIESGHGLPGTPKPPGTNSEDE